jgi:hypothetical protein
MLDFLINLGVRRHVELQLVFTRLLGGGTWSHVELTKYLVSVAANLTPAEMTRLTNTAWLLKRSDSEGTTSSVERKRYIAAALYEPTEVFAELGLDLLDWTLLTSAKTPLKWRSTSEEAKFLFSLGLKQFPPLGGSFCLQLSDHVDVYLQP